MTHPVRRPARILVAALFAASLLAGASRAQLNLAYTEGYRPLNDLRSRHEGMLDDENKRSDYAAVGILARTYDYHLEQLVTAADNIGKNLNDSSNRSWAAETRLNLRESAKSAQQMVRQLRERAESQQNCLGPLQELQRRMKDLDARFRVCWQQHEQRRGDLYADFSALRQRWWDSTKDDRRPLDEQGNRVEALRKKYQELQRASEAAMEGYKKAREVSLRALEELNRMTDKNSPDELGKYKESWKRAEDLAKNLLAAARERELAAEAADREYDEAYRDLNRAFEQYVKEVADSDELFTRVMQLHQRCFEFYQEYKPFSL